MHGVPRRQVYPLIYVIGKSSYGLQGYHQCRILTGADFENVFNLNLWAANAKLINYYMLYGYEYTLSIG